LSQKRLDIFNRGERYSMGQNEVCFQLFQGALRDAKKLNVLSTLLSTAPLGDIRRD